MIRNRRRILVFNRKGDFAVEPIVLISVGLMVLVILGLGVYLQYSDKINFFRMLPGFNLTEGKQEVIQIISYDIVRDKIEYFDGNNFVVLGDKKGVDLGYKRIVGEKLKDNFAKDYWYNSNKREDSRFLELSNEEKVRIYPIENYSFWEGTNDINPFNPTTLRKYLIPPLEVSIIGIIRKPIDGSSISEKADWLSVVLSPVNNLNWEYAFLNSFSKAISTIATQNFKSITVDSGETIVVLKSQGSGKLFGNFVLSNENKLRINMLDKGVMKQEGLVSFEDSFKTDFNSNEEPYNRIGNFIINWRDSILKKPVEINYFNTETKKEVSKNFCVEKKGDKLVVRLNEPTIKESCNV